jgi:hypothetical protein
MKEVSGNCQALDVIFKFECGASVSLIYYIYILLIFAEIPAKSRGAMDSASDF